MKYKLKKDRLGRKAGTVVYPYKGFDYGLAGDDTRATGRAHVNVSERDDGLGPFFTVPVEELEPA